MFIERIEQLLKEKSIQKKTFLADLNLNINTFSAWRSRGTVPSGATLQKIADYLEVSVDYLLGETEETKKSPSISDEDIKFALFGGEGEITDEMWQAVREYAQFVKEKYGKK